MSMRMFIVITMLMIGIGLDLRRVNGMDVLIEDKIWEHQNIPPEEQWSSQVTNTAENVKNLLYSQTCNIPRLNLKELDNETFLRNFINYPVILEDKERERNVKLVEFLQKKALLNRYHHKSVILSSANTHSYDKQTVLFETYVSNLMMPWDLHTLAPQSFYLFGGIQSLIKLCFLKG